MILIQKGFFQKKSEAATRLFTGLFLALIVMAVMAALAPSAQATGQPAVSTAPQASQITNAPASAAAAASADEEPTTPCDPQYMDALEKRAWLEAQREIAMNQNIIVKPDSVLEYTCFDKFMGVLSGTEDEAILFSETSCCGGEPTPATLNLALGRTVGVALQKYINQNFDHDFLGGHLTDLNYEPAGTIDGGTYECSMMQEVWERTQCLNFNSDTLNEDFFDFPKFADYDPRDQPYGMCNADSGSDTTKQDYKDLVNLALDVAFNGREENYTLNPENPDDDELYEEDDVKTFFDRILPYGSPTGTSTPVTCSPPIKTGITVGASTGTPYPDAVCPNPGCHYTGSGGTCCSLSNDCSGTGP